MNPINPATGLRPYPVFGQVHWRGDINNSSYEGFVASLQRSYARGLLLAANYSQRQQQLEAKAVLHVVDGLPESGWIEEHSEREGRCPILLIWRGMRACNLRRL
jgi:hypothetical protein